MDLIKSTMEFLSPFILALSGKYGAVAMVLAYAAALAAVVSVLIEILEGIVLFTASKKDDEAAARIKAGWAKVLPFIELLPHVNLPIAPWVSKALTLAQKALAVLKNFIPGSKAA